MGPFECRTLPGSPGAEGITFSLWRGPGSVCPPKDCNPDIEECCPGEGACCRRKIGLEVWACTIETPDECVDDGSDSPPVFRGIGTTCATQGICGGACCEFEDFTPGPGQGGRCFDVDQPEQECIGLNRTFLGPGTSCEENAGDCGLCCLVDPATGEIVCDPDLLQAECLAAGGTPFGPGAQCEICDLVMRACCIPLASPETPIPPGGPSPPGETPDDPWWACDHGRWHCEDVRSEAECRDLNGIFKFHVDCTYSPCILYGGACCCPEGVCPHPPCEDIPPGTCSCENTLQVDCPLACNWVGPGRACTPTQGQPPPPGMEHRCLADCTILGCD